MVKPLAMCKENINTFKHILSSLMRNFLPLNGPEMETTYVEPEEPTDPPVDPPTVRRLEEEGLEEFCDGITNNQFYKFRRFVNRRVIS